MSIAAQPKSNRLYKSRLFELRFRDKKELLQLYNAMNETNYDDPELLQINTLENAIYLSMHNDISLLLTQGWHFMNTSQPAVPTCPQVCNLLQW